MNLLSYQIQLSIYNIIIFWDYILMNGNLGHAHTLIYDTHGYAIW